MKTEAPNRRTAALNLLLTLLLLLGILSGAYSILRFGGLTMEVDAAHRADQVRVHRRSVEPIGSTLMASVVSLL